jgi:hypothetical protein
MSEVSIARKLEYRKFSPEAEKFQKLKGHLYFTKDAKEYQDKITKYEKKIKELMSLVEDKDVILGNTKEEKTTNNSEIATDGVIIERPDIPNFKDSNERIKELEEEIIKMKELEEKSIKLMSDPVENAWEKIKKHAKELKKRYQALGKFEESESTELWHAIIDSSPGWNCELDIKGEDSIRLFLIKLLPESNKKRKEHGLPEIKLSELGIEPEDLADLDLPESEIEKLF